MLLLFICHKTGQDYCFRCYQYSRWFSINYTRYKSAYYSDMTSLPDKHPEKWRIFRVFLVQLSNTFGKISVYQALKAAEFDSSRVREASYADFKNTHSSHSPQQYFSMTSSRSKSRKPSVLYRRPRRWQRARPQKLFCALIEIVCADDHNCWKPQSTNARFVKVPRPSPCFPHLHQWVISPQYQ